MTVTNTHEITVGGSTHVLKKYFIQIDSYGRIARKPLYAIDSNQGLTAADLIAHLTDLIVFKYADRPEIDKRAKIIARQLVEQLEASNDAVEVAPRRVACGAPSLGRTGLPTRPLVNA